MDNKEIQRKRMMRYFIDAAKEIIMTDGIKGLTARRVGEKAGYSYATIYNYFNDLSTLLTYCAFDFFEDCYDYMISFKNDEKDPKDQTIIYACAYFEYFAKHPDIFQLTFVENLEKSLGELLKTQAVPSVKQLLKDNLNECAKQGYIEKENIEIIEGLIKSSLQGKLLLFLNGRNTGQLEDMILSVKNEIKFIIKK